MLFTTVEIPLQFLGQVSLAPNGQGRWKRNTIEIEDNGRQGILYKNTCFNVYDHSFYRKPGAIVLDEYRNSMCFADQKSRQRGLPGRLIPGLSGSRLVYHGRRSS